MEWYYVLVGFVLLVKFIDGPLTELASGISTRLKSKNQMKLLAQKADVRKIELEERRIEMETQRLRLIEKAIDEGNTKSLALLAEKEKVPLGTDEQ